MDEVEIKVVLKQTVLTGSNDPDLMQRVAAVYIDGDVYKVLAPPDAQGDALEWITQFSVRNAEEYEKKDTALGILALKVVKEELEKKRDTKAAGLHPDGIHCAAQICLKGHVLHYDGMPFDSKVHCTKCGAACIDECPHCQEPIRGAQLYRGADYERPQYCHGCGRAYPWMQERLQTARELLYHDDKLLMEDRTKLWDDLQYVMSNPKDNLAPSKKKLIEIRLEKATPYVRDIILDLIAKTTAELFR